MTSPAARVSAVAKPAAPAVQRLRVDENGAGQRLDNYLVTLLKGVPKTHVYRVIRSGEVRVNKGRAGADTRLALGDELRIPPVRVADRSAVPAAPAREFPIVYEDDFLLAIDKPAGVAVHGGSGVSSGVIEQLRQARPQAKFLELVHRLDKETSGLLLIAKKRSALVALQEQLRQRETGKTYTALVFGAWPAERKVIDVALHKYLTPQGERRVHAVAADDGAGRRSITLVRIARQFRLAAAAPGASGSTATRAATPSKRTSSACERLDAGCYTLLDVTIKTGRTHQIRVHLTNEGHAIVGDEKYGDFALNKAVARGDAVPGARFERMFLHARRLRFTHPGSAAVIELESPLPAECEALIHALTRADPP
ncbi:MAG: pseudouridine synthase [Burkholderiaceae bacterium]